MRLRPRMRLVVLRVRERPISAPGAETARYIFAGDENGLVASTTNRTN